MNGVDRSQYFDLFHNAGSVSNLEELNDLPEGEFNEVRQILEESQPQNPNPFLDRDPLRDLTIEKRIKALPQPPNHESLEQRFQDGKLSGKAFLQRCHQEAENRVKTSRLANKSLK